MPRDFGKLFVVNSTAKFMRNRLIVTGIRVPQAGTSTTSCMSPPNMTASMQLTRIPAFCFGSVSLLAPGETPADTDECDPITPEVGITGTPVIDRCEWPHGTIYVVTMSKDAAGNLLSAAARSRPHHGSGGIWWAS